MAEYKGSVSEFLNDLLSYCKQEGIETGPVMDIFFKSGKYELGDERKKFESQRTAVLAYLTTFKGYKITEKLLTMSQA